MTCPCARLRGRFNEARAVSPGKSVDILDASAVSRSSCFNEARAVSPGKCVYHATAFAREPDQKASMRPGPFRPGNLAPRCRSCRTRFSSRFNEARAVSPGK